jgi:hypothetical protein
MKKNGYKYNTGSKYTNRGKRVQFKVNKDGTKDFRKEGNAVMKMCKMLLGKSNLTEEAVKKMKSIETPI